VAALIERDEPELVLRAVGEFVEHVAGDSETVEHQDCGGGGVAPLLVVQLQVVNDSVAFEISGRDHPAPSIWGSPGEWVLARELR
jgi:hypothetical protein